MVPLYRLTSKKCNFCTYIVIGAPNGPPIQGNLGKVQFLHLHCSWCSKWSPYTGWLAKCAISAPTLSVVLQMVPLYRVIGEKCNFCTYFVTGAPNGPPIQGDWGKVQFLHLHCQWCSKWWFAYKMVHHTGWMVVINQWTSKWHPYKADYLLTVWPYFSSGHEMGNLSFNIGGGLNGPLPFAGSL